MKLYEKISLAFTGLVYMVAGIVIMLRPAFLYYWVAGLFFIQGVVSLVRAVINIKTES
jgi:uncharacterized membrane protein HdeD (DUF308 family)